MSDAALGIWLVRAEGEALAAVLRARLGAEVYRPWLNPGVAQKAQFGAAYRQHAQWVMVAASGIAVRFLDGLAQDKHSDPALVVLDEAGRFAVSLLAGHEGGANELAYRVAAVVGAVPVVTTATEALKPLTLGIGCRKGVPAERIEAAVLHALGQRGQRQIAEVREVATVDLKANEPGLLEFCRKHGLPLRVFARATLAARPWVTKASDWVMQNVGLDGVCEPCALVASPRGELLVPKTSLDGVAVAVVQDKWMEI
ncbi:MULTISPECIES: cobalamin biosynthesis protein [unclassified Janthinobacterium]|uniref:cobalamin biosynthesis protein n=1 Tax=unclassified Janthinobacterium TaxID=2610881 RepID=UPI000347796E|nr:MULTISPECIES: cobalamin biosynthesis protein [unclassified Janthinobacterium]MEC5164011.1 cobalt-precorrin 5A hydrolase [Janthinobacterium sp. CG_S6]